MADETQPKTVLQKLLAPKVIGPMLAVLLTALMAMSSVTASIVRSVCESVAPQAEQPAAVALPEAPTP